MDIKAKALLLSLLSSLLLPTVVHARIFYVDATGGSDSNSGLEEKSAWKSLERVNSFRFSPGDSVLLKRGCVWHERLVISSSGKEKKPIRFGCYGSKDSSMPAISGFSQAPLKWKGTEKKNIFRASYGNRTLSLLLYKNKVFPPLVCFSFPKGTKLPSPGAILLQTEGTYRSLSVQSVHKNSVAGYSQMPLLEDKRVIVRQLDPETGREISWKALLSPPQRVTDTSLLERPGQWLVDPKSGDVFLYSDIPPEKVSVRFGSGAHGIEVKNCSHVEVMGIDVEGFLQTGVYLYGAKNIKISDVSVRNTGAAGFRSGILLFNSANCTVSGCSVTSVLGNGIAIYASPGIGGLGSLGNVIRSCRVERTGAAGISLSTDSPDLSRLVHDNLIEKNDVSHANTFSYDAAGIYLLCTGRNIIRANSVHHCGSRKLRSAGIMLDAGSRNCLAEGNTISANSLCGVAVTGHGHIIRNNTISQNGYSSWDRAQVILFPAYGNAQGCSITQNVIEAERGHKLIMNTCGDSAEPNSLDYNRYISDEPRPFCLSNSGQCERWLSFDSWKRITGQDLHSSFVSSK